MCVRILDIRQYWELKTPYLWLILCEASNIFVWVILFLTLQHIRTRFSTSVEIWLFILVIEYCDVCAKKINVCDWIEIFWAIQRMMADHLIMIMLMNPKWWSLWKVKYVSGGDMPWYRLYWQPKAFPTRFGCTQILRMAAVGYCDWHLRVQFAYTYFLLGGPLQVTHCMTSKRCYRETSVTLRRLNSVLAHVVSRLHSFAWPLH